MKFSTGHIRVVLDVLVICSGRWPAMRSLPGTCRFDERFEEPQTVVLEVAWRPSTEGEDCEIGLWSQEPQESNQYFHSFSVIVESSRWCHLSHKHFNSHDPPTLIKSKPCCEPCGINQGKPGWEEFWEGKVSDKVVRSFWMKTPTPKQQFCFCYDRVGLKTTVNITWPDLTVFLAAEKQLILASD